MKNNIFLTCLLLAVTLTIIDLHAQKPGTSQIDSITTLLKQFPTNTQFAIAVIDTDSINYQGYVLKKEGVEKTENSMKVFEIGSITKVFTSELLMHAVAEKKVKLDKPIKKYLKEIKLKDKRAISLTQLSNHSSGLPRMPENALQLIQKHPLNPFRAYGETELIDYLEHWMELKSEPGEQYAYSNLGAALLGYILTKVEKKSYEELIQQRIAQPLAMEQTTTEIQQIKEQLVKGLNAKGEEVPNWEFKVMAGAGAIFSSTNDLSKWLQRNFSKNELLAAQRAKTKEVSEKLNMAYGWHIIKNQTENPLFFHNGGTGGYHSFLVFEPQSKTGLILLTNVSAFHPKASKIDLLGFSLIQSLLKNQ